MKTFIVDYLLAQYRAKLLEDGVAPDAVEQKMANFAEFAGFAHNHMHKNRPSQITHEEEGNYGIVLTNHARVLISPHLPVVRGSMQDSAAVPVTGQETLEEMRNAAYGIPTPSPGGMQDTAQPGAMQDMTQPQAGKDYKG